jgi:two-component sensor histidine kinase
MNRLYFNVFYALILLSNSGFWRSSILIRPNRNGLKIENQNNIKSDSGKINSLLNLASVFVNKKGEDPGDLNKAITYGQQALQLSQQNKSVYQEIEAYTILSQCYREKKNNEVGKKFAELAVRLLPDHAKNVQAADAFAELSTYYDPEDQDGLVIKLNYYTRSVRILRKVAPGTKKLADALKFLGDLKNTQYDIDGAVSLLKESIALYQSLGIKQLQDVYDLLGDALTSSGNTVEGLSYQLRALKMAERFRDTTGMISTIYYRLAFAYNAINQDNHTVECMEKARDYALKNHNVHDWILISANLATTYNKLKKYQQAVKICQETLLKCPENEYQQKSVLITNLLYVAVATRDLVKAEPYYRRLKDITENHNIHLNTIDAAMIEYLITIRQYGDARLLVKRYIDLTNVTKTVISKQKIEHYQFQLDSAAGNYLAAINHLNKSHQFKDSLLSRTYNKQIARMQMTFDLQKKDQDIAFKAKHINLLTRQNQLQKVTLRNQGMIRNLFIASVILLVLLLGLGYNRYKIKQNANDDLQEQQEEINTQNESLRQLLDERDWLLKEVHHRVKNNLQIVISLLNSQSYYLKDQAMLDVLKESQHRIRSISLVHQKLYQGHDLSGIDMFNYIHELVQYLQDSFNTQGRIAFLMDIEHVTIDVSQAVPIGLILNEAITNSIKYAFQDVADAQIKILLKVSINEQMEICIADNGCGLPMGFNPQKLTSLGMSLMKGLSRQIGATLDFNSQNGLCIILTGKKITFLSNKRASGLKD